MWSSFCGVEVGCVWEKVDMMPWLRQLEGGGAGRGGTGRGSPSDELASVAEAQVHERHEVAGSEV